MTTAWIHDSELPLLEFERLVLTGGARRIAGVDEAGRGPLAGPVVAAAVVLAGPIEGVNDSKKLTPAKRERLYAEITQGAHAVGVAVVPAQDIDRLGIQAANYAAMDRAAQDIEPLPDFLLVDGFAIHGCALPQKRIIKGDQRSQSIAAASIIAKVTRDRIMVELHTRFPEYGFAKHKGYGTRAHMQAIEEHGPCAEHRKSFAPMSNMAETGALWR
jgi:ribonuclease HII